MPATVSRPSSASAGTAPVTRDDPRARPTLAHMVIFNSTLASKSAKGVVKEGGSKTAGGSDGGDLDPSKFGTTVSRDKTDLDSAKAEGDTKTPRGTDAVAAEAARDRDLEDDLREAAQIVFYTAREVGVSRDRMLRQVGLAKGLMGFADMVSPRHPSTPSPPYWAVHAQHQRLIVYSPEPNWYIYICIALPRDAASNAPSTGVAHAPTGKDASKDKEGEYARDAPDAMLVAGLQAGYDDFRLRHSSLAAHLPPTPRSLAALEGFWTRFALAYEAAYVAPGPSAPILTWLGGWPGTDASDSVRTALTDLINECSDSTGAAAGLVTHSGPVALSGPLPRDRDASALVRYFLSKLGAPAAAPAPAPKPAPKPERAHLGFGFGRRRAPEPPRPASAAPATGVPAAASSDGDRRTSWGLSPLSWVGLGSAPASRSASPMPPKETKEAKLAPEAKVAPRAEIAIPAAPPVPGAKPRWPSFGAFGDAMGNVGAALGLAASPKPGSHVDKPGRVKPNDTADNDADGGGPDTKGDAEDAETTNLGEDAKREAEGAPDADKEPVIETAAEDTVEVPSPSGQRDDSTSCDEMTPRADADEASMGVTGKGGKSQPFESSTTASVDLGETTSGDPAAKAAAADALGADDADSTSDRAGDAATDAAATDLGDTASIMTHTSLAPSVASDLAAAAAADVELPWSKARVYICGDARRVFWVIRERMLLFVLAGGEDTATGDNAEDVCVPPTPPALAVFTAARRHDRDHSERGAEPRAERRSRERERDRAERDAKQTDTTIYHAPGNVTDVAGAIESVDAGTLAALRALTSGTGIAPVSEVFAQTPSGRFAVAKRVDAGGVQGDTAVSDGTTAHADTDATPLAETPRPLLHPTPAGRVSGTEELFGLTARRDAGLTDAERLVREFAMVRPQFG